MISIDAKPSIQARARIHPTSPPAPGRIIRVEHEYQRQGALALLAALDIHTGQIIATTPPATGIVAFMTLIGQIMTQPRYRDAGRVFIIVDNGSDHRGTASIDRLRNAVARSAAPDTQQVAALFSEGLELAMSFQTGHVENRLGPLRHQVGRRDPRVPATREITESVRAWRASHKELTT
jgi:hypothetical protein